MMMNGNRKLGYLHQHHGDGQTDIENPELVVEKKSSETNIQYLQVPIPSMLALPQRQSSSIKGIIESQNSIFSQGNSLKSIEMNNIATYSTNLKMRSQQILSKTEMTRQNSEESQTFKMGTGIIGRIFMLDYLKLLLNYSKKIKENRSLSQEDIPQLEMKQMVDFQHEKFSLIYFQKLERRVSQNKPFTDNDFLTCLFKLKMKSFMKMGLFLIFFFTAKMASSVCIQYLLQDISGNSDKSQIYMWVAIICFLLFLVSLFDQFYVKVLTVEYKLIVNIIMKHVHTKVYSFSAFTISQNNIGQLMNIITNDLKVIDKKISETLQLPILPLPLIAAGVISYFRFGLFSLIGLAFLIICVPIQAILARISKSFFSQRAKINDKRMQITHEVLESIRLIKLYSWEEAFIKMLNVVRSKDLRLLLINQIILIIENSISMTSGILSSFLIFYFVYKFDGPESLTLANMFSTLDIFQFLRSDVIGSSGIGIAGVFELKVVMKRIVDILSIESQQMLNLNQIKEDDQSRSTCDIPFQMVGDIKFSNFSAFWKYDTPVIQSLNCSVKAGQLITITGPVSSGKSSLLSCLIKEIPYYKGEISFKGKVAYVEQEPIIYNMSLRDNILFGQNYDPKLYEKVIQASNLTNDIEILGGNDMIEIGEKGSNLSGGQKARLALARALYQQADIYLLDDPLSALDYNVIKEIFQKSVKEFLKGKTVLLTTHNFEIVSQSDYVLVLEKGQVIKQGHPKNLKEYLSSFHNENGKQKQNKTNDKMTHFSSANNLKVNSQEVDMANLIRIKSSRNIRKAIKIQKLESTHSLQTKTQMCSYNQLFASKPETQELGSFVLSSLKKNESDQKKQQVSFSTYKAYFGFSAYKFLFFICIGLYMSNEVISIFFTKMLGKFNGDNDSEYEGLMLNLGMLTFGYFAIMLLKKVLLMFLLRNTNYQLHKSMILSILSSKISYFDNTPIGSVINRFSSDLSNLDIDLPKSLSDSLEVVCNTLTLIVTLILLNPYFLIIACISAVILFLFFSKSKDVLIAAKQFELNQKSKVFSFFNTSVQGILPIKIFNQVNQFKQQFNIIVNNTLRSDYSYWFTARGFGMYIIFIAQITSIIGIFMAVMINSSSSNLGQTITFFISLGSKIQVGLRQVIQLDATMSSAQRAFNMTQLEQEPTKRTEYDNSFKITQKLNNNLPIKNIQETYKFPQKGRVEFKNVYMSYSKKGSNVLNGISFSIQPGQKVAFVGRTGAGKSSILQALFRMFEISKTQINIPSQDQLTLKPKSLYNIAVSGPIQMTEINLQDEFQPTLELINYESCISIDGHNISDLGVKTLREGFSIIPQVPFIFTGSLKMNLDPYSEHSEEEIWQVIRDIKLEDKIKQLPAMLETELSNSCESFSTGQKQLICLGRALLKKSKILVLDEVTSSCDTQTEELILELLNTKFIGSTVIAIAHRLITVADYDQIIVMKSGQIAEQGTSEELLSLQNGIFTQMVKSSGQKKSVFLSKSKKSMNEECFQNQKSKINCLISTMNSIHEE